LIIEALYAEIPAHLADADAAMSGYGRWAASRDRARGVATVDREYRPPWRGYDERREPGEPMMPALEALRAHRAFIAVAARPRAVLALLYVPHRKPIELRLRLLGLVPRQCRELHLDGLRMFRNHWEGGRLTDSRIAG
jgi:hypothetical protein